MRTAEEVAVVLGVLAVLFALALGVLLTRRTVLSRSVGAFDCALRRRRGWVPGVARYTDDRLEWFRLLDLSWRPTWSVPRQGLSIVDRRVPDGLSTVAPTTDWVLVRCRYPAAAENATPGRPVEPGPGMLQRLTPTAAASAGPAPGQESTVELGMSEPAYTGLATWLESAPPGEHPLLT